MCVFIIYMDMCAFTYICIDFSFFLHLLNSSIYMK